MIGTNQVAVINDIIDPISTLLSLMLPFYSLFLKYTTVLSLNLFEVI